MTWGIVWTQLVPPQNHTFQLYKVRHTKELKLNKTFTIQIFACPACVSLKVSLKFKTGIIQKQNKMLFLLKKPKGNAYLDKQLSCIFRKQKWW